MRRLLGTFDAEAPSREILDPIVRRALEEDHAFDDRSTRPLPGSDGPGRGRVIAKESGVLAGAEVFRRAFEILVEDGDGDRAGSGARGGANGGGDGQGGRAISVRGIADGSAFEKGTVVLEIEGPAGTLLSGERTALNFLQRLSGIATQTRRAVDAAAGKLAVCDTRKTTPGLRALEKWAVVLGGGTSHRWSLGDMVMLKENHLALAGGVGPAVAAIRVDRASRDLPITVEVTNRREAMEAAALGVDRLLLDNFDPKDAAALVTELRAGPSSPELEISGGVRPEDVGRLAPLGVDCVSLGALTHSARALDLSFLLETPQP